MNDYNDKIKRINELTMTLKQAFQPMPPGAGGAPPPMDPAMMQQGAPPMDPAAMQQGAPPPTDPAQIEAMLSEVMSAVEQMAGALEQQGQASAQLQQQLQQIMSEHAQVAGRLDMMEKAIKDSTSPLEGVGVENM